jgi:DNA invertase Pin-like site-specific DNA recombinase/peptidoglycan hydrolase-like protein with peptidoglycan-binding domain
MERTYRKPGVRAGLGALTALLVLLAGTGTCVAGGAVEPVRLATMAEAAPLDQGAGYGSTAEAKRVRALQRVLRKLGWAPGRVDGLFGPRTEAAVLRFQAATGLARDGVVGRHAWKALADAQATPMRRGAGYAAFNGSQRVRALQRSLQRRGLKPGPVDGRYGPRTEAAVARAQRAANLTVSGAVDTETRQILARGPGRQDSGNREVPVQLDGARPQTQRIASFSRLAKPGVTTGQGEGLSLALVIGGLALIAGALSAVLLARTRSRARAEVVGRPSGEEGQEVLPVNGGSERVPEDITVSPASDRGPVRAVGYASVQQANGSETESLESQAEAINRLCESRGWELLHVVRDVENGHPKGLERPGLLYALERVAEGEASCLVVSELERLSRSAADLGRIVEWIEERDGRLVAIDLRLDTGSAQGRLTARTLVAVGEWEGRRIADQTRKGLAAARARRATTGRPAVEDLPALKEHIVMMRNEGMTLQAIADRLNAEGVPTLRGGSEWRPSSVQAAAGYRRPKGRKSNLKDPPKGERS